MSSSKVFAVCSIISVVICAVNCGLSAYIEKTKKIKYDDETIDKLAKAKAKYDYEYANGTIKD